MRCALALLCCVGCGDGDGRENPFAVADAGTTSDAMEVPGIADGGPEENPDSGEVSGADPLFAAPNNMASPDDAARCVEADSDARGAPIGCEQSACQMSRACCVGRADCCVASPVVLNLDFATCDAECAGGTLFGAPLPTLAGAFAPGGDAEFDSGLVLDERVDLRGETVRLTATFATPTSSCSGASCFQTVGVSLARNAPSGANAHVSSIAGLLWSQGRMYLVVGERSIQDWPAEDGGDWSLTIDADGDVRVEGGVVAETFATPILPAEAWVVLHGHNVNPGGGEESAELSALTVSRTQCEMTRQWSERIAVEVGSGARSVLTNAHSPTTVFDASGRLRIAYVQDERLVTTFRGDEETPNVWVDAGQSDDAADRPAGAQLRSPELAMEDGEIVLYYESEGALLRAEREAVDDEGLVFGAASPITGLEVPEATLHAPTYASRAAGAESALVARVEWTEGNQRATLAAFSIRRVDGNLVAQLHDLLPTRSLGEEIGDPELFIRNQLYQLYVPYRRGTRWRLAHMTSEDFLFWTIADERALEADGAEELFGPRAPEAVATEEGVELFYERFDGNQHSLGRVFRRTPANAYFQRGI